MSMLLSMCGCMKTCKTSFRRKIGKKSCCEKIFGKQCGDYKDELSKRKTMSVPKSSEVDRYESMNLGNTNLIITEYSKVQYSNIIGFQIVLGLFSPGKNKNLSFWEI